MVAVNEISHFLIELMEIFDLKNQRIYENIVIF